MKSLGGLMFLFGAGSMLLGLIGYEFTLMMWVDNWGPTVGWFHSLWSRRCWRLPVVIRQRSR